MDGVTGGSEAVRLLSISVGGVGTGALFFDDAADGTAVFLASASISLSVTPSSSSFGLGLLIEVVGASALIRRERESWSAKRFASILCIRLS